MYCSFGNSNKVLVPLFNQSSQLRDGIGGNRQLNLEPALLPLPSSFPFPLPNLKL